MIDGYVHPRFAKVATLLDRLYRKPTRGGGALTVRVHGEVVVDVWAGWVDPEGTTPWLGDTMALSFSTTKGVASTVAHILAGRGEIDLDATVASYWPEFGANGKEAVTVRELMSHQAGLHDVRSLTSDWRELLDHELMEERLAALSPSERPGAGYHGITYGWLIGGLVRRVTGVSLTDLVQREIAEPLGLDGLFIGCPPEQRNRIAPLFPDLRDRGLMAKGQDFLERTNMLQALREGLIVDGFDELLFDEADAIFDAEMAAVNGVFTARSLAAMYSALANRGEVDGVQLLDPNSVLRAGELQFGGRDYVVGFPMKWRVGYHQAFTAGVAPPLGFGHFGFGGSGGWADPATGVSVGFTTNRLGNATTPFGDARLARIGAAVMKAATG